MLKNSKQGLNAMPPKGTCTQCSDAQLQAAIQLMLQFD
jgi:cytochrome c5